MLGLTTALKMLLDSLLGAGGGRTVSNSASRWSGASLARDFVMYAQQSKSLLRWYIIENNY